MSAIILQQIIVDDLGKIHKSDNKIFTLTKGKSLQNFHPFFEIISSLPENDKHVKFDCVNLEINEQNHTLDIAISKGKKITSITITDLTHHYINYQTVVQSRNESMINSENILRDKENLEKQEVFKNRFIQNFSQELRNPLMNISSFTGLLGSSNLTEEQKDYVNFINWSNDSLKNMLEDILDLGSISLGLVKINQQSFNILSLFQKLERIYELRCQKNNLVFNLKVDEKIPKYVNGDEHRFYQVLDKLLDNAIKYTPSGNISLKAVLNQKWGGHTSIHVQIADTGVGIPKKDQLKIFESFVKIAPQSDDTSFGLGLAAVKSLLSLMKSEIKLTNEPSGGSVFYFDISFKVDSNTNTYPISKKDKTISTNIRKHKILLLVDDEKTQLFLFKFLLDEKQFDIHVLTSTSELITDLLTGTTYDIIVIDTNLRGSEGMKIAGLLRDLPVKKIKSLPLIGITTNGYRNYLEGLIANGLSEVLVKPFKKERFLEIIQKHLK